MKNKYPIILVHGVMIKDFRFFKAFGKIEKVLKDNDILVYTAKIDGLGTIENNAIQLKNYINKILEENNVDKVNLIAHSKGGLDSKYMIENLDIEDKIASLTTLATPFNGSPIATKILTMPKFIIWWVKTWFNVIYKIFGDKNPDGLTVCKQLSEVNHIEQECLKISNKIYCQSYSTTINKSSDDFIMGIPLMFSKYFNKEETDGLVPINSTKLADYKGNISEESFSHTQIVDFMTNKTKKEKIHKFYLSLCSNLIDLGF